MRKVGRKMAGEDWTLRSGTAPGADTAFEEGADELKGAKEIYLPCDGYRGKHSSEPGIYVPQKMDNYQQGIEIARQFHPDYSSLGEYREHIIRDGYQILGQNLVTPCQLVICWTVDGCTSAKERTARTGGTGQAISIADSRNIPIYNLKLPRHREKIAAWLENRITISSLK